MSENNNKMTIIAIIILLIIFGVLGSCTWSRCPSDLNSYCSDWTTTSSLVVPQDKHIETDDEFNIRGTWWGFGPLLLTAKGELATRWKNRPKISLREVKAGNQHACMVGRVDLSPHGFMHDWHQLTFETTVESVPGGGSRVGLDICLATRGDGSWPTQCEWVNCDDPNAPQSHGGRAHAQN